MPRDSFYSTRKWLDLREAALTRDQHTCVVGGCHHRAFIVDHIKARRNGGADALYNLRSLCRLHDNQTKEDATGTRRNGGKLTANGCDADGQPLDPAHWWVM